MTTKELRMQLNNIKSQIADTCHQCKHNCNMCLYEGKCVAEFKTLEELLIVACCSKYNFECANCEYLGNCPSNNAFLTRFHLHIS